MKNNELRNIVLKLKHTEILSVAEKIQLKKALQGAICEKHSGKMDGMQSLSTSVILNKQCKKNAAIDGSVCGHCYAAAMFTGRYKASMPQKYEANTMLLTEAILPLESLPAIYNLYFRFEAFGDLMNAIQVVNYINICNVNPLVKFALWTKNPQFIDEAMNKYGVQKPENLNIIYSSLILNKDSSAILNKYGFIDKVFTVYTPEYIKEKNIDINCGARSCAGCLNCYTKNDIKIINEKLK